MPELRPAALLPPASVTAPAAVPPAHPPAAVSIPLVNLTLSQQQEEGRQVRRCRWCHGSTRASFGAPASLSSQLQAPPHWSAGGTVPVPVRGCPAATAPPKSRCLWPRDTVWPRAHNARRQSEQVLRVTHLRSCVASGHTPPAGQDLMWIRPPAPPPGGAAVAPLPLARGRAQKPHAAPGWHRPRTRTTQSYKAPAPTTRGGQVLKT